MVSGTARRISLVKSRFKLSTSTMTGSGSCAWYRREKSTGIVITATTSRFRNRTCACAWSVSVRRNTSAALMDCARCWAGWPESSTTSATGLRPTALASSASTRSTASAGRTVPRLLAGRKNQVTISFLMIAHTVRANVGCSILFALLSLISVPYRAATQHERGKRNRQGRVAAQHEDAGGEARRIQGEVVKGVLLQHNGIVHGKGAGDHLDRDRVERDWTEGAAEKEERERDADGQHGERLALPHQCSQQRSQGDEDHQDQQRRANDLAPVGRSQTDDTDEDRQHDHHRTQAEQVRAEHLPDLHGPPRGGSQQQLFDRLVLPFPRRCRPRLQQTAYHDGDHHDRDRQVRDVIGILQVHIDLLRTDGYQVRKCASIKRGNGERERATDIVGKVSVQVVDLDLHLHRQAASDPAVKVPGYRHDSHHISRFQES